MNLSIQQRAHGAAAALLLGLGVLYNFSPTEHGFYPRCPFFALTHLLCPGCGGTRALYQLLHLHLGEALRYNALVTVLFPVACAGFIFWYYSAVRYGRSPRFLLPGSVMACLYVVVILFAVLRNSGLAFVI
jgi:hypothetical protein